MAIHIPGQAQPWRPRTTEEPEFDPAAKRRPVLDWVVHVSLERPTSTLSSVLLTLEAARDGTLELERGSARAALIEVEGEAAVTVLAFGKQAFELVSEAMQRLGYVNRLLEEDPNTGLDALFVRPW